MIFTCSRFGHWSPFSWLLFTFYMFPSFFECFAFLHNKMSRFILSFPSCSYLKSAISPRNLVLFSGEWWLEARVRSPGVPMVTEVSLFPALSVDGSRTHTCTGLTPTLTALFLYLCVYVKTVSLHPIPVQHHRVHSKFLYFCVRNSFLQWWQTWLPLLLIYLFDQSPCMWPVCPLISHLCCPALLSAWSSEFPSPQPGLSPSVDAGPPHFAWALTLPWATVALPLPSPGPSPNAHLRLQEWIIQEGKQGGQSHHYLLK